MVEERWYLWWCVVGQGCIDTCWVQRNRKAWIVIHRDAVVDVTNEAIVSLLSWSIGDMGIWVQRISIRRVSFFFLIH